MVSREKRRYSILLFVITTMVALAILSRIFWLTLLSEPQERTYRDPEISPRVVRGSITDRNGRLFAIETPYYSCALLLRGGRGPRAVAAMLRPTVGRGHRKISSATQAGNTTYIWSAPPHRRGARASRETDQRATPQGRPAGETAWTILSPALSWSAIDRFHQYGKPGNRRA